MTNGITGLTQDEVKQRISEGKVNEKPKNSSKTIPKILFDNIVTYFNLVHLFLFLLVVFVEEYRNALFIVIILTNTIIGIVQEIRAKKTVDRLTSLTSQQVTVIRDGKESVIPSEKLVLGDTVLFRLGDKICADARVLDGDIEVNESLQTGEPNDIRKVAGDTLISGSYVTAGEAYAVLEQVGKDSFAYKLTKDAKKIHHKKSEILRSLNMVVKVMGIVIIPVGLLLYFEQIQTHSLKESIVGTVSSVVGMIPCGLFLLTSIALTVSVIALAKKRTLVREMYSIEALARTDILCLDKTGTLTTGEMELKDSYTIDPSSHEKLALYLSALDGHDPTSVALRKNYRTESKPVFDDIIPFSSDRKWSACKMDDGWYMLGAFDRMIDRNQTDLYEKAEEWTCKGVRVLAFGKADSIENNVPVHFTAQKLLFIGEKIRHGARDAVAFFQKNDVKIVILSGDHAQTASAIAASCGVEGAERCINLTDIHDDMIPELIENYCIFGRVTPKQKKLIVKAFHKKGHTVSMTGDGVNDVLALKEANCGISMSSGADMAREVGDVVLLDNDWTALRDVVMEGRRVIRNIERSGSLFFVKTMYSLVLSLLCIVVGSIYPFESIQMSLISSITVGIPGFLLALERTKRPVRKGFLKRMLLKALPSAVAVILSVSVILLLNSIGAVPVTSEEFSTCASLITLFIGYVTLFYCCYPLNKYRLIVFGLCFILGILAVSFFPEFFSLSVLSFELQGELIATTISLCVFSAGLIVISRFLLEKFHII